MTAAMTIECEVHFSNRAHGRKELRDGPAPTPPVTAPGRIPRVSRLMALAIRFDELVRTGVVADYAELARLGQVSRARISQIMNLLQLAPDIQEAILFSPRVARGRSIQLWQLQPIAAVSNWKKQRTMWARLCRTTGTGQHLGDFTSP